MGLLTTDYLPARHIEKFDIPGTDSHVYLKPLSVAEAEIIERYAKKDDATDHRTNAMQFMYAAVDDKGEQLFDMKAALEFDRDLVLVVLNEVMQRRARSHKKADEEGNG